MSLPWRAWRYTKRTPPGLGGARPKPWGATVSGLVYHGGFCGVDQFPQMWRDWLGHEPDLVSNLGGGPKQTWTDIAGGPGTNPETIGGQLDNYISNRMYDTTYWPVERPIVEAIYLVPSESRNVYSSGSWTNPGIWSEVVSGTYDSVYRLLARRHAVRTAQTGRDPRTVVIEFEPEFTGTWRFGSVGPDKDNFVRAWRRIVGFFREAYDAELGPGRHPLFLWRTDPALRFGTNADWPWRSGTERLWHVYPGDEWCDIVGLSLHDYYGVSSTSDLTYLVDYPGMGQLSGTPYREGWNDFFDWAHANTTRWLCSPEFGVNSTDSADFPYTSYPDAIFDWVWNKSSAYRDRWLFLLYLSSGKHDISSTAEKRAFGDRFKQIWGQGGLADLY